MIDVVVPHDLSARSDRGLKALEQLHVPVRHLHVLHVLRRVDRQHPGVIWSRDEDTPRHRHALGELVDHLKGTPFANAALHVRIGDPGHHVVALARELSAGLLVIGSHGRRGLGRMMLGSVAEHVARFAPCPVLIVPPEGQVTQVWRHPDRDVPTPAVELTLSVHELCAEVQGRVEATPGTLAAVTITAPPGHGAQAWGAALETRLREVGITWVDVGVQIRDQPPEIIATRFEAPPD